MLLFIINLLIDKHLLSIFMCQILILTQGTGTFSDLTLLVNCSIKVSMSAEAGMNRAFYILLLLGQIWANFTALSPWKCNKGAISAIVVGSIAYSKNNP